VTSTRDHRDLGGRSAEAAVHDDVVTAEAGAATTTGVTSPESLDESLAVDRDVRGGRLPATAEGTSSAPFTPLDWGLVALASIIWGASFLLIAEGLEAMEPGVVAWLRIAFGFAVLAAVPAARRARIDRADLPRIVLLAAVWLAIPMTLFPVAEQWVSSSVAGMLNGALPLFSAPISAFFLRRAPGRNQLLGIAVGFVGVVLISLPSMQGGSKTALGATLVIMAMVSYGFAGNLMVPLQQRYGAIGVIWRVQMVALVLTLPYAFVGVGDSTIEWKPMGAVFMLGALGTGVAFVAAGTLMGRVGATRGSIIAYLIPVVALILGVLLRDEHVEVIAVGGLGLVLVGAYLTSRAGR
jgi:drug/metabolite transporter (DMT)-like permease